MLRKAVRCHARQQHSANPKVCPGTLAFGDECIGCLLNTVVEELVGAIEADDQPRTGGLPERRVDLLFRFPVNQSQGGEFDQVPETRELLEGGLRRAGQSL